MNPHRLTKEARVCLDSIRSASLQVAEMCDWAMHHPDPESMQACIKHIGLLKQHIELFGPSPDWVYKKDQK